jgi:hypothetical protein
VSRKARLRCSALNGLGFVVLLAVFLLIVRPWFLHWGATAGEIKMPLPGDELVPHPAYISMRALTVEAPPDKVWPWLAQIGQERAGFYSYTWFENLLGADYHNAERIHPEWQDIRAGGYVWNMPESWRRGRFARLVRWPVVAAEPGRFFVLGNWGTFYFEPVGTARTRLLIRGRQPRLTPLSFLPLVFLFDPGHFAMEKRMMVEVKRLAEGRPASPVFVRVLAWAGFTLAAVVGTLLIVTRRGKWPWTAAPLAWFLGVLLSTGDLQAALTAFVAMSLILAGFIAVKRGRWLYFLWWWMYIFSILVFASDAYLVFGILFLAAGAIVLVFSLLRHPALAGSAG